MQTVSREIVLETWNEISALDKKAARQLTRELFQHQPAIGIYCAAQDENLAEKGTVSPMIDLTMLTWKSLTRVAGRKLPIAAPEVIEAAEEVVTKQLEKLGEGSEMDMQDAALKLFENHNQREIMRFGIEVLMSRYAETPDLAPESLGLEMIWLNTVVECLDNLDFNAPPRPDLELDMSDWPEPDLSDDDDLLESEFEKPAPIVLPPKTGRNDPCPCGSGKKFKKCCGRTV